MNVMYDEFGRGAREARRSPCVPFGSDHNLGTMHAHLLPSASARRQTAPLISLGISLWIGACVGLSDDKGVSDSMASAAAASAVTATSVIDNGGCLKEGDWSVCSVEDRLMHAGVVIVRLPDSVVHAFFSVPGLVYQVGNKDNLMQLFLYPTTTARRRDTDALDSTTVSPRGSRMSWPTPPTLVTSNNMAVIILSLNDRTVERLALALGAGLPQPSNK